MKICSKTHQIALFKKHFLGKHAPKPYWQTPSYATRRKPLRGMQLAQTPKDWPPLANPAYAHGLRLKKLFKEMAYS